MVDRRVREILVGGNVYGAGNIGDDAILAGCAGLIERELGDVRLTVETLRGDPLEGLNRPAGFVSAYDEQQVDEALRRCDCFVAGGGTLIGEELGLYFPLKHLALRVATAKSYGKPVILMGIGANAVGSAEGRRLAGVSLALADLVILRDEPSRRVCADLGDGGGKLVTAADPAFLLKPVSTARSETAKTWIRSHGRCVGINVVNEAWTNDMSYKRAMAAAGDEICARHGVFPVFFQNEVRPGAEFDREANVATARLMRHPFAVLDPTYFTPGEMIDVLSAFDAVAAMRMHALIFAALAGTPFAAISRIDKVDNLMQLFGRRVSGRVGFADRSALVSDLDDVLQNREAVGRQVASRALELRRTARSAGQGVRKTLGSGRSYRRRVTRESLGLVRIVRHGSMQSYRHELLKVLHGNVSTRQAARRVWGKLRRYTTARHAHLELV